MSNRRDNRRDFEDQPFDRNAARSYPAMIRYAGYTYLFAGLISFLFICFFVFILVTQVDALFCFILFLPMLVMCLISTSICWIGVKHLNRDIGDPLIFSIISFTVWLPTILLIIWIERFMADKTFWLSLLLALSVTILCSIPGILGLLGRKDFLLWKNDPKRQQIKQKPDAFLIDHPEPIIEPLPPELEPPQVPLALPVDEAATGDQK